MTHVSTPQAGAFGRKRTRSFGPIVAAVAIVVAAGAAVATGIALSEPEATSIGTESIYGNLEALKYTNPPSPAPNRADQVHRGRTPAIEGAAGLVTSTAAGRQTLIDEMVRQGLVPTGAIPTGQTDWRQRTFDSVAADGYVPAADLLETPGGWFADATGTQPEPFYESPGQPR